MNKIYKLDLPNKQLRQQPEMEKPEHKFIGTPTYDHWYKEEMAKYNSHLASLLTLTLLSIPEGWVDGQELINGKDFYVVYVNGDHIAYPHPIPPAQEGNKRINDYLDNVIKNSTPAQEGSPDIRPPDREDTNIDIVHNGMHLSKDYPGHAFAILFAEYLAEHNYEHDYNSHNSGMTSWNEVDDPQLHGEDGPEVLTTNQVFIKFEKWVAERYNNLPLLAGASYRPDKWIRGQNRPKIVCLCGSTRFMEAFQEANLKLTCEGVIVLSVGCNTKSDRDLLFSGELTEELKISLDELHKRKIDLADEVCVLNVGGYIGESTRSEIDYAIKFGKPVHYLEPLPAPPNKQ